MNICLKSLISEQFLDKQTNFGCLMAIISPKKSSHIVKLGKTVVPPEILYTKDNDYGYEEEPHVTIKFGFTTDLQDNDIHNIINEISKYVIRAGGGGATRELNDDEVRINTNSVTCENKNKGKLILGANKISIFENTDYDVVKMDINKCDILKTLNQSANKYPHIDTYNEYHPHLTLAYVQKGKFNKEIKNRNIKLEVECLKYSGINGSERYYYL